MSCDPPKYYGSFLFYQPPTSGSIVFLNYVSRLPFFVQKWMNDKLTSPRLEKIRKTQQLVTGVASNLVQTKIKELKEGERKADVMSLLGRFISLRTITIYAGTLMLG
jgi:hypothetical protein